MIVKLIIITIAGRSNHKSYILYTGKMHANILQIYSMPACVNHWCESDIIRVDRNYIQSDSINTIRTLVNLDKHST